MPFHKLRPRFHWDQGISITPNNYTMQCLIPVGSRGMSAVSGKIALVHYNPSNVSIATGIGGKYFTTSTTNDDIRSADVSYLANRAEVIWLTTFFLPVSPPVSTLTVYTDVTNNSINKIQIDTSGAVIWTGDVGQTIASAAAIVSVGRHTITAHIISPTGSNQRTVTLFLDGQMIATDATKTSYINIYLTGPREFASPIHSPKTVMVNMVACINGALAGHAAMARSLSKDPYQIWTASRRIIGQEAAAGFSPWWVPRQSRIIGAGLR